jgi:dihydroxy-acid dehydratase
MPLDLPSRPSRGVTASAIAAGDVVAIRNEGSRGGPGMRGMLAVTAALSGAGLEGA